MDVIQTHNALKLKDYQASTGETTRHRLLAEKWLASTFVPDHSNGP